MIRIFLLAAVCVISFVLNAQPDFNIVGYATLNRGTSGGQGGTVIEAASGFEIEQALNDKRNGIIDDPLIIMVNGVITPENSSNNKIDIKDVDDVSLIGVGTNGEFFGIGIKIWRANNIIVQNLKIHHVNIGDKDCIGIEGPSGNIWIDHCELYNEFEGVHQDFYDGLLDIKRNVDFVTISWNHLHNSWKASLSGSSDSDNHHRTVTYHHNFFENINSRLPLFRFGNAHIFNNYYKNVASTAINSRMGACVKIENNYFENVKNPYVSAYSSTDGFGDISGNILEESYFEYRSDTRELQACEAEIPYSYESFLVHASEVPEIVSLYAGVGVVPANLSDNAALFKLTVNNEEIPDFDPGVFIYTVEVEPNYEHLPIVGAVPQHSGALVSISQINAIPGQATVEVLAENGEDGLSYTINFELITSIIDITELNHVKIFPNPLQRESVLEVSFSYAGRLRFELINVAGQSVLARDFGYLKAGTHQFHLGQGKIPKGVYSARIEMNNLQLIKRVLVLH
jgi:pectate lyase